MARQDELEQLRLATGADLDSLFLRLMLRHHEGGASMLRYAGQHAALPEVGAMANRMLIDQIEEAQLLNQLLA